jgi:glycosidase
MNKYLLLFGLIIFVSCSKKKNSSPSDPTAIPQYGTPYANVPATTTDISLYEVNERAYSTTGDFNGIIPRLDSIKALDINVIWLMPINPIGQTRTVNSPYCVKDHLGVNSEFGTLADLRNLISTAHSKNMAVILDWAANQTSWDNAWITEHPSWYEQDGSGNIISPPGTPFTDVAQLNYNNDTMRLQMIKDMIYWIHAANFDGFRCDFADNIPDNFWAQAIDSINNVQPARHVILLAEGGSKAHFTAGFQMIFGEEFYDAVVNGFSASNTPQNIYNANADEYSSVTTEKERLRFTTTHDHAAFTGQYNGSPMSIFNGKAGALAASAITINMPGVPLIYGSQEVGITSLVSFFEKNPINWTTNPDMVAAYKLMLNFHNSSTALKTGALTTYADPNVVCYTRVAGSDSVLVIANIRNSSETLSVPGALQGTNWINAYDGTSLSLSTTLPVTAYQYTVLKNH